MHSTTLRFALAIGVLGRDGPGPSAADPAVATFRIRLIMERGLMRQRISPGSDHVARGAGMDVEMTPGMALEDVWT